MAVKDLKGAEILKKGTWNGQPFSVSDLDAIVSSFETLGLRGKVPLKFGHDADHKTDGQPAYGWVDRLWRDGETLMADFASIPERVYEFIQDGMYKNVSVEVIKGVKAGTRVIPWVLDAVALLGADQPAVGTLKDLQGLTLGRKPAYAGGARFAFTQARKFSTNSGDHTTMDENQIKALIEAALKPVQDANAAVVTKLTAKNDELSATIVKMTTDTKRNGIKAKFERAVENEELLPAKRDQFYKFARIDDDAAVLHIADADVDAYLKDNKLEGKKAVKLSTRDGGGDEKHAETNGEEVTRRVELRVVDMGGKVDDGVALAAATRYVLSSDRKLARAYIENPRDKYEPNAA